HLSPAGALWQVPRVAQARHVSEERVRALVESQIERRDLLVLGEARGNVLTLNLALDRQFGALDRTRTSATRTPRTPSAPAQRRGRRTSWRWCASRSADVSSSTLDLQRGSARPTGCWRRRTRSRSAGWTWWWASSRPTAGRRPPR